MYEHLLAVTSSTDPPVHLDTKSSAEANPDDRLQTVRSLDPGSEEECVHPTRASDSTRPNRTHTQQDESNRSIHILGCDIDARLIHRANQSNPYPNNIVFKEANVMDQEQFGSIASSFLESHSNSNSKPSSNVFNLTCCFSVTMWIHLHHGDQGLLDFLKDICKRTQFLIIEPQPWKCYRSAVRRIKKLGQSVPWQGLEELKIREDVDEQIEHHLVTQCDMKIVQFLGETAWKRRLVLLKNCNI